IFDFAGLEIPRSWQGKSLAGYTRGEDPVKNREEFICEHLWEVDIIASSEGIRTNKWKYFRYINDPAHEELYDLEKDPWEKKNLANKKAYRSQLEEMKRKFDNLIEET